MVSVKKNRGCIVGDLIRFDVSRIKEADFQKLVIDIAHAQGFWVYHNPDSRRSSAGWPDLVLVREPEVIFVELKSEKGRVREQQQTVLNKLSLCNLETYIWRPRDLDKIFDRLKGKPNATTNPNRKGDN
jgi:hypothetical protein